MATHSPLASWDASKRQRYSAQQALTIHLLLDASASMAPYAQSLRACYGKYLAYLKQTAPPGTRLDQRCFNAACPEPAPGVLREAVPLVYQPEGGTHLYDAVGSVIEPAAAGVGRHLLLVLSDGEDGKNEYGSRQWTAEKVSLAWDVMEDEGADWLPVFLGAFPEALAVGLSMGFAEGNCLTFDTQHFPEAFALLTDATGRYLRAATTQERKLLAAGLFR